MKQDNKYNRNSLNSTKNKSREEILESILEETARNPYKPGSYRRSSSSSGRTTGSVSERKKAAEKKSEEQPVENKQEVPENTPETTVKPVQNEKKSAKKQSKSEGKKGKHPHTQVFSSPAGEKKSEGRSGKKHKEVDMTRVMSREEMSEAAAEKSKNYDQDTAEDKIKKIQKEKAAAAKAAIIQKTEIENARYAQYEANKQAFSLLEDEDEKVNIFDPDNMDESDSSGERVRKGNFVTEAFNLFSGCVTVIFLVYMVFTLIFGLVNVVGDSMLPTLSNGDRLLLMNIAYVPQKGDVVVVDDKTAVLIEKDGSLNKTEGLNFKMIKRVIAVGGDTVDFDFKKGEVMVNGAVLNENYIMEPTTRDEGAFEYPIKVPNGYVFVLGDNRNISKDSRHTDVGLVPEEEITGRVLLRVYPFGKFGTVD